MSKLKKLANQLESEGWLITHFSEEPLRLSAARKGTTMRVGSIDSTHVKVYVTYSGDGEVISVVTVRDW